MHITDFNPRRDTLAFAAGVPEVAEVVAVANGARLSFRGGTRLLLDGVDATKFDVRAVMEGHVDLVPAQ